MNLPLFSTQFSIDIKPKPSEVVIHMQLAHSYVNTRFYPNTISLLKKNLPEVLDTQCFNDLNLPFRKEAEATEIGHLFEHILLEYMCLEKLDAGYESVVFNGITKWNWKKNSYGSFDIYVDANDEDKTFFETALIKATLLTDKILESPLSGETPAPAVTLAPHYAYAT